MTIAPSVRPNFWACKLCHITHLVLAWQANFNQQNHGDLFSRLYLCYCHLQTARFGRLAMMHSSTKFKITPFRHLVYPDFCLFYLKFSPIVCFRKPKYVTLSTFFHFSSLHHILRPAQSTQSCELQLVNYTLEDPFAAAFNSAYWDGLHWLFSLITNVFNAWIHPRTSLLSESLLAQNFLSFGLRHLGELFAGRFIKRKGTLSHAVMSNYCSTLNQDKQGGNGEAFSRPLCIL